MAHNITLYSNTSLNDAYKLSISQATKFLESEELKDWIKVKESEQKLQAGIADRLNGVISAVGVVAKSIGALARR